MPPLREILTSTVEKLFFRSATVTESTTLSGHFRQVVVQGDELKHTKWTPGQKVQFHLGNMVIRTYTPMTWEPDTGCARFLFFLHGNGPGSDWSSALRQNDRCQLMGPRDSLDFASVKGPVLFYGDETSFAAACALHLARPGLQKDYFFEVSSIVESEEVLRRIGMPEVTLVQRREDNAHLSEIETAMASRDWRLGLAHWILTGKAQSIQELGKRLRARRAFLYRPWNRAYWSEGKAGLD